MTSKHFKVFHQRENFNQRWFLLHLQAAHATTDERKRVFIENLNILCDNFGCKECQGHFRAYLAAHPFDSYWNMIDLQGNDIGFYEWTRIFHNSVNVRLGKRTYTHDETYSYYKGDAVVKEEVCEGCKAHKSKFKPYKFYRGAE
jgi:hypothetical protein